jgi:membrane-associated phospholipid phosphatase
MKITKDVFGGLGLLITIPIISIFYDLLNNSSRGAYSLITDIDRGIPLIKLFILPYISWFIYIFLTFVYLCIKDKKIYYKTLIAYNISLILCYVVYFFYQTTVPRPDLIGDDMLTSLVAMIYTSDQPFNCFPSIHSLTSYLMIKAINKSRAKNKLATLIIYGMSSLIILSTLFVKQHVILDALSAILLGDIVFNLVYKFDKERALVWINRAYSLLIMRKRLEIQLRVIKKREAEHTQA